MAIFYTVHRHGSSIPGQQSRIPGASWWWSVHEAGSPAGRAAQRSALRRAELRRVYRAGWAGVSASTGWGGSRFPVRPRAGWVACSGSVVPGLAGLDGLGWLGLGSASGGRGDEQGVGGVGMGGVAGPRTPTPQPQREGPARGAILFYSHLHPREGRSMLP